MHQGNKATLLRLGEQGPPTPRITAKLLAKIWRKALGRQINPREFGCLVGLSDIWGSTAAPKLLQFCIQNWPQFMVAVKHQNLIENTATEVAAEDGEELILLDDKFFKYPCIPVIRRYHWAAASAYKMHATHPSHSDTLGLGMWITPQAPLDVLGLPASYKIPVELL